MFATKQTTIVPDIHGEQNSGNINLGQIPNLELESEPGHMIQEDGGKFDLQFGRMALGSSTTFAGTVSSSATFPAGHIIQIAQVTTTDTQTFNNQDWTTTVSNFNPSLITKKTNSKILVETNQFWGGAEGGAEGVGVRLYRNDGTGYAEVTATRVTSLSWSCWFDVPGFSGDNYAPHGVTASYLDSPNVAAGTTVTYAFHARPYSSSYPVYFNKGRNYDSDTNGRWRPLSSATLMEIAS